MSQSPEKPFFDDPFEDREQSVSQEATFDLDTQDDQHTDEEWQWAMLTHLAGFGGFVIPFGSILGPLIIWSMKKKQMPFVDTHGKRAVNFNLTVMLAALISIPLMFIVVGIFTLIATGILWFVFTLMAVFAVSQRKDYQYPFSIRFIK